MLHETEAAMDFLCSPHITVTASVESTHPVVLDNGIHSYRMKCESDTVLAAMLYTAQMAQHVAREVRMVSYVARGGGGGCKKF